MGLNMYRNMNCNLYIHFRRPNCRTCSCYNDNRCYNTCDKCYQGYNNYNTGGLVVIRAEVVTSEVVIAITEIVTAITEIVTAEVDTQIAIHVPVHIQALVGDLATNAITLVDGGEMELTAPILGKHLHLPPLQIIMAVVLLTLVTPKMFEFAFIIFLVQNISAKILRNNKKFIF